MKKKQDLSYEKLRPIMKQEESPFNGLGMHGMQNTKNHRVH